MSKELTDAWKAGKLKALRFYYVLYKNGHIGKANLIQTPDYYGFWNNCDLNDLIKEVLALVPEYTEFVHLETIVARQAERIKELEQDVKTLTNNYKLLEKQQAENLAHGQALVDEFGDFETLYEELQNLRSLLKECKDAYQIYIPLFKMLKNEEAVKTAVNLANKIGEVID